MTVTFQRNEKTFTGKVLSSGFYRVDEPESYEVQVGTVVIYVPIKEVIDVNG